MRPAAFFGIGQLLCEDRVELGLVHARSAEHARALHLRVRGNDDDCVDALFRPRLQEQRNVEHDDAVAAFCCLGQELLLGFSDQGVDDGL